MRVAHLLASPFYGGPERQVLGFSQHMPADCETTFLSFAERGKARDFLDRAQAAGFPAHELRTNWPNFVAAINEVTQLLRDCRADCLCTSGYKPDLIGWRAARRFGIPVVSIAHGWTGATSRVRFYEAVNRRMLRYVDRVVGVSEAQTVKNRAAGIPIGRTVTISNAIDPSGFAPRNEADRKKIESFFPHAPKQIVVAAGRLSVEKGFDVLIQAAVGVLSEHPEVGFLVFGSGPEQSRLETLVAEHSLSDRFVLGGFRNDLARLIPQADLMVLSSHTEGLPVIALEAMAASLPVVSTAVGGMPELIEHGVQGLLVPPGNSEALGAGLKQVLGDKAAMLAMGAAASRRIHESYTADRQAQQFYDLFAEVIGNSSQRQPALAASRGGKQ